MNKITAFIQNHRSVRAFKPEKIEPAIIADILETASRGASSNGLQMASIIRIDDPVILAEIAEIATQPYIKDFPEFWIFIVDVYRNFKISEELGHPSEDFCDMANFFQGYTDAVIMAQNAVTATEAYGLGNVYIGAISNNVDEVIKVLNLPKLTYPVVGLGFGYPDANPHLKPRMDINLRTFKNGYQHYDSYLEAFKAYDDTMVKYYGTRDSNNREDSFTNTVLQKQALRKRPSKELMAKIERQGFKIK